MSKEVKNSVAIVGIGTMGKKLTGLLREQYQLSVWNRTRSKVPDFSGVHVADTVGEALTRASSIIICVHDFAAIKEILDNVTDQGLLKSKIVVNFTTISAAEASELETILHQKGSKFVNGALQVAPDQMGLPDTTILLSGSGAAYEEVKPLLLLLGGNHRYLGEQIGLSAVGDLATLTWFYGSYFGMIHAVELCRRSELPLASFSSLLSEVAPGFIAFMQHQVQAIEKNDFTITQSPLSISVPAVKRIGSALTAQGIDSDFWQTIVGLLDQAVSRDLLNQELASIIQVLDTRTHQIKEKAIA